MVVARLQLNLALARERGCAYHMTANSRVAFEFITTAAPIQAEGTVGGRPFFFHARHDEWKFAVAEQRGDDPAALDPEVDGYRGWFRSGHVSGREAASSLSELQASAIIHVCAAAYLRERAG
jgi:hypothetical protein